MKTEKKVLNKCFEALAQGTQYPHVEETSDTRLVVETASGWIEVRVKKLKGRPRLD